MCCKYVIHVLFVFVFVVCSVFLFFNTCLFSVDRVGEPFFWCRVDIEWQSCLEKQVFGQVLIWSSVELSYFLICARVLI